MTPDASELRSVVDSVEQDRTVVVVFADSKYKAVLDEWLVAIGQLGIPNFVVVALDEQLLTELVGRDIAVLYRPCPADLESLWIHRTDVLLELLEAGYNLVHSDADALWRKDPFDDFIAGLGSDLIFSPGTYWPADVYREWGFVLCCGFFYAASNTRTRAFFAELTKAVRIDRDDQVSLNRLLLQRGLTWPEQESYELVVQERSIRFFREPALGKAGELEVCVLPHAQFQRLPEARDELYIQHWLADKNSQSKINVIESGN